MEQLKKIPDAMTDFRKIIDSNYVFIDKTRFLEVYEESGTSVSLFLRPRRFGKTMFTELLRYYYDKALESATHPTPLKSSFYVLRFDFSGISVIGGIDYIINSFMDKIVNGIENFFSRYPDMIPKMIIDTVPENRISDIPEYVKAHYKNRTKYPTSDVLINDFLHHVQHFSHK